MQTRVEETGNRATATGKIWKLVYKAHAVQRKGVERTRCGTRHGPAHGGTRYNSLKNIHNSFDIWTWNGKAYKIYKDSNREI